MNSLRIIAARQFLTIISVLATILAGSSIALAEEKVNPSGTWRWEYDWQGETVKDSLRINLADKGKVIGTFQGQNTTKPIENGKLEGDKLSFDFELDLSGTAVGLRFEGTLKKDDIDGTVIASVNGEDHEFPWTPKRSVQLEDVFGKWQIRIDTPDGNVLEPKLEIKKDGDSAKATYVSQSSRELDVKNLKIKDNHLTFTVEASFNGTDFRADYKGRPYGNAISGNVEYDFGGQTGELEFSGKMEKPKKEK